MSAASSPKNDVPAEATPTASSLPSGGTWSGRFAEPMSARMQRFNASIDFDRRLAEVDIVASRAHARMLAHTKIISADDLRAIESGLAQIQGEIERGDFEFTRALEDVHFNIERRLTALVGDAGKRLHTARSRNDQVATDLRLWLRAALDGTSYPIDRASVARELGFERLCENSIDAVSDRDFAIEFAAAAAQVMVHLSRLAEELVLWSNPRFGFVTLADRFCTGSSIM